MITTADNHSLYKNGAKEIAALHGKALTFMAKFNEREGNSCHIHMSLRGLDGETVFADDDREGGHSELFDHFVAGVQATLPELTLLYAPNVNSYKRFQPGSFAPTAVAWGRDNRTCALRVVGHGAGLRVENRVPGGDVNPYLALSAMLAGGLLRHRARAAARAGLRGQRLRLRQAARAGHAARGAGPVRRVRRSRATRSVQDVVDHYVNAADIELSAFEAAVTDWERFRGFERL